MMPTFSYQLNILGYICFFLLSRKCKRDQTKNSCFLLLLYIFVICKHYYACCSAMSSYSFWLLLWWHNSFNSLLGTLVVDYMQACALSETVRTVGQHVHGHYLARAAPMLLVVVVDDLQHSYVHVTGEGWVLQERLDMCILLGECRSTGTHGTSSVDGTRRSCPRLSKWP